MNNLIFAVAAVAGLLVASPACAQDTASVADQRLKALYDEYWVWQVADRGSIEGADGDLEPGATIPSSTAAAHRARAAKAAEFRDRLDAIGVAGLSPDEKVNAAVLRAVLTAAIEDARFSEWEMPFDSDSNFWSYWDARRGYETVEEYERYIARMRALPRYFDEQIANARAGLNRGFSVPRVTLVGRETSLAPYVDFADNPFWKAFEQMPARFADADRERLQLAGRAAIAEAVVPSYRKLRDFLTGEYFPTARSTLAAEAMPDGKAYYRQQIRQYTTLDLSPEEIHRTGLQEVARIESEMRAIMAEVGFDGTIAQFTEKLRTDPRFIATSPDDLMGVSSYVAKRVDGRLTDYFGFLPRRRFTIRPVPDAIAPFYTAGRGGLDACQMNTHDLPSRPLYNIPALTLHECAPGHSFQMAFQLEQGGQPKFRRNIYFSGMGEGWGLYTEFLGEEMGIYRTPEERFGRLSYEMWRAVRLVVDTGIHHYGWDRDRAVAYLADRTALSRHEVGTEVDRYISWPGQALAYKLGEMTIRRLRSKAEQALGERFDIRKFHDVVLALGSVPLPELEARIEAFIADGGQGLAGVTYD
ncbi:hypothetical protein A6F68_02692 [Tsuneonella dongtanensis]|uniref:DUF885 domain-containing protein n=1 Tax=Tsuneonella dongtanensis TaxID=692370 RepID=A0A1B2AGB5_9SPHN|nr:DUF885 family protein [Tsuneonella dongtanensis]ANY21184.1 hypothetical protein A6F68_02692 [Tsuneonella dongtanensis]